MRHNIAYYLLRAKQLLCLEEAIRFGSISKASGYNDIKQPNFSAQLTDFEKQIRQKLLIRNSKGVSPTDVGLDYYYIGCEIKNILERELKHLQSLKQLIRVQ